MKMPCELASRDSIRAFYFDGILLILAKGTASAGDRIDIDMVRPSTTPLEFLLERCPKPGFWPKIMQPYLYKEFFVLTRHPDQVKIAGTIRVHHQDGVDDIRVEPLPEEMRVLHKRTAERGGQRMATGYSSKLSFEEAFEEAVKILSAEKDPDPDALLHVRVDEVGGLFGGFAGFHLLYVRLVADSRTPVGNGGIVEVAPERPGPIEEIAPDRPQDYPPSEVITEVAPAQPSRPDSEVIVEVAPDRPEETRRQGPITEVAPDRPENGP